MWPVFHPEIVGMAGTMQWVAQKDQGSVRHLDGGHARHPAAIRMSPDDRPRDYLFDEDRDCFFGFDHRPSGSGQIDRLSPELADAERHDKGPHAAGVTR